MSGDSNTTDTEYVVGFMFNTSLDHVVLIEKNRPKWQKGLLNGVGGKLEWDETFESAMVREFEEETGVTTEKRQWIRFVEMFGPDFSITMYACTTPQVYAAISITDENVRLVEVAKLQEERTVANVQWLVPMARDCLNIEVDSPKIVSVHYRTAGET